MKNSLIFKILAIVLGVFICIALLEASLRLVNVIVVFGKNNKSINNYEKTVVFAGDSWTAGCDASAGKSFFSLLYQDKDLNGLILVNYGYGGNNFLQVANSIIGGGSVPKAAIVNGGVNSWHLLGLKEFIINSEGYLSEEEIKQFRKDFNYNSGSSFFQKLRIYKLYCYLFKRNQESPGLKSLDSKITSAVFWEEFMNFRDKYQDRALILGALPEFISKNTKLSLDEKFYFVGILTEFNIYNMEQILRKAVCFYPEKLKIVAYNQYKKIDISRLELIDTNEMIIKWSMKLLGAWSRKHNVIVWVQSYPDIKKEQLGDNSLDNINKRIATYAKLNGLEIIDYNTGNIDWKVYRTCWHVNNQGHQLMANYIKPYLFKLSRP